MSYHSVTQVAMIDALWHAWNFESQSDHTFITKSRVYIIWAFVCPLYCAYCALKALVGKPTKTEIVLNYVHVQNNKCRFFSIGFCVLLLFFAYVLFVVRSICGSAQSLGAARWDHGRMVPVSRNNIFCVSLCLKKLQNIWTHRIYWHMDTQNILTYGHTEFVSLIHGLEFVDLTLNVVPQAILILMSKWWPKVLVSLDFRTFDPNVPMWHVYKIWALFAQISVQSSNRTVFFWYFWRSRYIIYLAVPIHAGNLAHPNGYLWYGTWW